MPLYEFVCENCSVKEEAYVPMNHESLQCERCGGVMRRILSVCSARFIGAGFYNPSPKGE